jgi:hypothetical protein
VFEYRTLRAHRDLLRLPLERADEVRLTALERMFIWRSDANADDSSGNGGPAERRRFSRVEVRIPAQLRVAGSEQEVLIVNLGAGGVVIEPAPKLARGELVLLKVCDESSGRGYILPAQAIWKSHGPAQSALGLSFVGIPREAGAPIA